MTENIDMNDVEEAKLQEAIQSIHKMSARRRLRRKEWIAFFGQDDILKIISQEKFLRELGDCFTLKELDDDLYQILMAQLSRVNSYLQSEHINLTDSTGSNPLTYAISKIDKAHAVYLMNRSKKRFMGVDMILNVIRNICRIIIRL